ncbi:hypothetical protein CC99x_006805 [Candidatus Berkiella cookevillensis]|uniref:Uncharacterized protein n=1 Tax=Candidatus Berkiella cookevillensis TaxID=437022 RepID=A0A0Q9YT29_9GAMM|nr:hypothetical protein [Candidatus Berkiella cookevillensis]MCS5708618.1 hypothetical protein [Candidatus Berkiella cookevillensis]
MTDAKKHNLSENTQEKSRKKLSLLGHSLPILQTKSNRDDCFDLIKLDLSAEAPKNKSSNGEIQISRCYQLDIDKNSGKSKINIFNHVNNEIIREIENVDFIDLVYKLHN